MRPPGDATAWRRSFCVPSECLYTLQSDVIARKVPTYIADWESFDGDVDKSCFSAIKKISTVKPSPRPLQRSWKRHNCRCTTFPSQRLPSFHGTDFKSSRASWNSTESPPSRMSWSLGKIEAKPTVHRPGSMN